MKKIVIILLFALPVVSIAQKDELTWDYPVKPGSQEWLRVENYFQRLELLNIPDDILSKLSTKQLVKICFEYPQIELIFTKDNILNGISFVSVHFNGFIELSRRKDAGKELLRFYSNFDPNDYITEDKQGKIEHKKDFIVMELMLSSPVILRNMNEVERTELLNVAYNMYEEKAKYWDKFYSEQISPNLLIMAQILEIDEPSAIIKSEMKDEMEILIQSGITRNAEFVTALINDVNEYLN
ncbi:MAG TPA: hypothetical protein VEP89_07170 [Draconibacterium sp.]|nr:hypothetical protein [Draconibacterium sp.]